MIAFLVRQSDCYRVSSELSSFSSFHIIFPLLLEKRPTPYFIVDKTSAESLMASSGGWLAFGSRSIVYLSLFVNVCQE